jgi:hypothetical protein
MDEEVQKGVSGEQRPTNPRLERQNTIYSRPFDFQPNGQTSDAA